MKKLTLFNTIVTFITVTAGNAYATTSNLPYTTQITDVSNFIGGPWTTGVGASAIALAGLSWMKTDGGTIANTATRYAFGGATAYSATSLALWMGSSGSVLM